MQPMWPPLCASSRSDPKGWHIFLLQQQPLSSYTGPRAHLRSDWSLWTSCTHCWTVGGSTLALQAFDLPQMVFPSLAAFVFPYSSFPHPVLSQYFFLSFVRENGVFGSGVSSKRWHLEARQWVEFGLEGGPVWRQGVPFWSSRYITLARGRIIPLVGDWTNRQGWGYKIWHCDGSQGK